MIFRTGFPLTCWRALLVYPETNSKNSLAGNNFMSIGRDTRDRLRLSRGNVKQSCIRHQPYVASRIRVA